MFQKEVKVVFKAEPAPGKCVENWTVKKKQNDQNSGKTRMMSVTAMDDSVSPADDSAVKFIISDGGKTLTIPNLTESVDVSVKFMDAIDYKIKSIKDAVITVGDNGNRIGHRRRGQYHSKCSALELGDCNSRKQVQT